MFKYFFIILLMVISEATFANTPIGQRTVSKLMFHDSGNLYVFFSGSTTHGEACDDKSIYILPNSHKHFSEIYSGLLAAMYSKAKVNGYVNGCIDVWGKTKPKITRIDLLGN
jgi:hypothetical protein